MGAPPGKPSNSHDSMQRVKVYRLNDDGKWDDQGTGHVMVDYLERSEDLGLIVIDEEDNDTLLVHRISSDEIYRRQEDTIISWRDPELSTELALSFQETTGCSYIWDQICNVQRNLHFNTISNMEIGPRPATEALETTGPSRSNDESFHAHSELGELPPVELSTLPLVLKTVLESGVADQTRVAELILQDQVFFPKLIDLFRMSEDLENIDGLRMICKLVKGIVLLNSPPIFEKIFGDEYILDIIGSLEYDPDVPKMQHHRKFLKEHVVFKEAIPIKDTIVLSKIHQTYRIGYIKDVILPRVLDEGTMASINSIIHGNNVVVISLLKDDSSFIQELFRRMRSDSASLDSKRNMLSFLHEFCSLSKSLQLVQQIRLFRDLASEGLFDIITDALQSQDRKLVSTGTEILILFLNQDPNLLRMYVIQQEGHALLRLLVKGMTTEFGEDMHCQFLEIIRILLDSYTSSGSSGSQRDTIIEVFYEKHLDQLIDVITASCSPKSKLQTNDKSSGSCGTTGTHGSTKPEILSNICELLCFCVLHHPYRLKCNFLMNNAIEKVMFLTRRREKYLVVAAVRFMRTIISRNDEHLLRHIVKNNLLKPVIDAFIENGNRYNMLHSGILELLEYIRRENFRILVMHIVDHFWDQLSKFEHLGTIQALKIKYDQSLENCQTQNAVNTVDPRRRIDERALEKEEEDYFNEDSDEDDSASHLPRPRNQRAQPSVVNGINAGNSSPSIKSRTGGLVDYDDDDDDEDYKPPPKKLESSTDDDKVLISSNLKRGPAPLADDTELKKKRRLDQQSNDTSPVVACLTSSHPEAPSKSMPSPTSSQNADSKKISEEINNEKASVGASFNCLPEAPDVCQSTGDDSALAPISNSSPEIVVNSANSEPYSVR